MTVVVSLILPFAGDEELRTVYTQQLSKGRAFVKGAAGVSALQTCTLVLEHAGRRHELTAEAVFVKEDEPGRGVGLQLAPLDASGSAALRAFVEGAGDPADVDADTTDRPEDEPPTAEDEKSGGTQTLQERIRGLSHAEQQRVAANGSMQERIALERTFGPNVWEALLANPRLTIPEVAKIARKGTLPRPLVENIAGHPSWLAAAEVQRALLGNPRSTATIVAKVLGCMSRAELALVPQQTAYPQGVRAQARKLLGR